MKLSKLTIGKRVYWNDPHKTDGGWGRIVSMEYYFGELIISINSKKFEVDACADEITSYKPRRPKVKNT